MNEIQKELLQLLNDFHNMCKEGGLNYSITMGTLLGAVRHKGFIPHDDDADVFILKSQEELLLEILENQTKYGYAKFHSGYKVFYNDKKIMMKRVKWSLPFLDVFVFDWRYDVRNLEYAGITSNVRGFKTAKHYRSDMYPLKQYKFENIVVLGPMNPYPFLDKRYERVKNHGIAWHEGIVSHNWDHTTEKRMNKKIIRMFNTKERLGFFF
tara:strand:+ start:2747 stop:3376 length:630 start_codon:yes stop_codon:yes gene_type:complete